ncbi:MAG: deaminase [Polyangiaceae bacterium]|nr:deaminase [Polyangiaceae bacterium]
MGKVLWHATISLDGFIAGPHDAMEWVFEHAGPNPAAERVTAETGALLVGRRSYDVARMVPAGIPQFVLTHRTPDATPEGVTFLSGEVMYAVSAALAAAGKKDLVVLGANVAKQCLSAGLVDEILVHVAPLLLGEGLPFYRRAGSAMQLEPLEVSQAGAVTNLRFRVKKRATNSERP